MLPALRPWPLNSHWQRLLWLSPALAALLGGQTPRTLPMNEAIRAVGRYTQTRGLRDATYRQRINCDDALAALKEQGALTEAEFTKLKADTLAKQ